MATLILRNPFFLAIKSLTVELVPSDSATLETPFSVLFHYSN